ncbi:hypothetical protein CBR_g30974 [Chara braunii]|uniref:Reverse transcriptase domain-containing protein n=1 Tax=Chara braunii TaxID=69332 RepID=A0A388LE69_CHABU|nr:hypothetical protein CBR_g30974 [Chara braunii]|eukprot:GBG80513.1 hypothetical protein CBR_g30974 [Chara braunii]
MMGSRELTNIRGEIAYDIVRAFWTAAGVSFPCGSIRDRLDARREELRKKMEGDSSWRVKEDESWGAKEFKSVVEDVLYKEHTDWFRCPMGICNAPATFQRAMNMIFQNFVRKARLAQSIINYCVILYMDDILVYSSSYEGHVQHIEWALHALRDAGFKVALEKCQFFLTIIPFMGHVVTDKELQPEPLKVAAVRDELMPTTITQIRAFLGLASYYRRIIKGFTAIAGPLTNLLRKHQPLIWTSECDQAFSKLKAALISAPVLIRPDPEKPLVLITNWQPEAISAIPAQVSDALMTRGKLSEVERCTIFLGKLPRGKRKAVLRETPHEKLEFTALLKLAMKAEADDYKDLLWRGMLREDYSFYKENGTDRCPDFNDKPWAERRYLMDWDKSHRSWDNDAVIEEMQEKIKEMARQIANFETKVGTTYRDKPGSPYSLRWDRRNTDPWRSVENHNPRTLADYHAREIDEDERRRRDEEDRRRREEDDQRRSEDEERRCRDDNIDRDRRHYEYRGGDSYGRGDRAE